MKKNRLSESKTNHEAPYGGGSHLSYTSGSSDNNYQKKELPVSGFHDDSPISNPNEDVLNYGVFAKSIARCILGIRNANGGAIAIHGPWGAGKSSVINLVRHELEASDESLIIISFNCWHYRSEDGIVAGFFRELYLGLIEKSDGIRVNLRYIRKLGLYATTIASISSPLIGISWLSSIISSVSKFTNDIILEDQRIDTLQEKIGESLEKENKRILVIIDDIDRLSKEEVIAIFRVIKSVGRLRNVIYLLAYDRVVTERMIRQIYPFEGAHYLEKIIQASFDLPRLNESILIDMLSIKFDRIFGDELSKNSKRTNKIVNEIVIPEIKTPRDIYRLTNMLHVTYQLVEGKINVADFIALETIRLFRPHIYQKIQSNKAILIGSEDSALDEKGIEKFVGGVILGGEPKSSHFIWRKSLARIFPILDPESSEYIYGNVQKWSQERRVCSELDFDKYFSFSIVGDAVSDEEFQEFARQAGNSGYMASMLRTYSTAVDPRSGRTKVSFLLEKIARSAEHIDDDDVWELLITVYSASKDIRRHSNDRVKKFGHYVDNGDRIINLTKSIINTRGEYFDEFELMHLVYEAAPIDLLVRLACSIGEYAMRYSDDGSAANVKPKSRYYIDFDEDTKRLEENKSWRERKRAKVEKLRSYVIERISDSISDHSFFLNENLFDVLVNWKRIADNPHDIGEVLRATLKKSDKLVMEAAREFDNTLLLDFEDGELNQRRLDWINEFDDDDRFTTNLHNILRRSNLTKNDRDVAIQFIELIDGDEVSLVMS